MLEVACNRCKEISEAGRWELDPTTKNRTCPNCWWEMRQEAFDKAVSRTVQRIDTRQVNLTYKDGKVEVNLACSLQELPSFVRLLEMSLDRTPDASSSSPPPDGPQISSCVYPEAGWNPMSDPTVGPSDQSVQTDPEPPREEAPF